mmetsp:Transcript_27629/g.62643  ORF Transcript_27629/g.62643 Transcript_27629/m.62643 type:complete len:283 (+) Transcript_27629:237-1085(+)
MGRKTIRGPPRVNKRMQHPRLCHAGLRKVHLGVGLQDLPDRPLLEGPAPIVRAWQCLLPPHVILAKMIRIPARRPDRLQKRHGEHRIGQGKKSRINIHVRPLRPQVSRHPEERLGDVPRLHVSVALLTGPLAMLSRGQLAKQQILEAHRHGGNNDVSVEPGNDIHITDTVLNHPNLVPGHRPVRGVLLQITLHKQRVPMPAAILPQNACRRVAVALRPAPKEVAGPSRHHANPGNVCSPLEGPLIPPGSHFCGARSGPTTGPDKQQHRHSSKNPREPPVLPH